jgi:hypothetical protein
VLLLSLASHTWWVLSLIKFAGVSQGECDHGHWTLPFWRVEWGRKNDLLSYPCVVVFLEWGAGDARCPVEGTAWHPWNFYLARGALGWKGRNSSSIGHYCPIAGSQIYPPEDIYPPEADRSHRLLLEI